MNNIHTFQIRWRRFRDLATHMTIASEYYFMEFKSFKWLSSIIQTIYNHKQSVQAHVAHNIEYEKYRNFVPSEFQSKIIIFTMKEKDSEPPIMELNTAIHFAD